MSRKTLSILLTTLMVLNLALAVLTPLLPMVRAARGNPLLAAVNITLAAGAQSATGIVIADYNVSIKAGKINVTRIDGNNVTGYFTIIFKVNDTWIVQFDGSQFYLYMSKSGLAQIDPDDKEYAGPFDVSDLTTLGLKQRGDYYIGTIVVGNTRYAVVIGPIPSDITADYKYIKVFDGLTSQVAVSSATVVILPTLILSPVWGPAGRIVTLTGTALRTNASVNLTYSADDANTDVFVQVWTDEEGKLSHTWPIKDLKASFTGVNTTIDTDTVTVCAWYGDTGELIDCLNYTEYRRAIVQLLSLNRRHVAQRFVGLYTGSGNATLTVDATVFDTIVLAGAWWNPRYPVEIVINENVVATANANETHGFFNTTFTVPELPVGLNPVVIRNGDVNYIFWINVTPTLIVQPKQVHIGDIVEVYVYGFPANSLVRIYMDDVCVDGSIAAQYNVVNGTTGPDGKFNVTVTFEVPRARGGLHTVWGEADGVSASDTFEILPTLRVEVAEINATYRKVFKVIGEALDPGVWYSVAVDNAYLGNLTCDVCGYGEIILVGAGFRPGLHAVAIYREGNVGQLAADPVYFYVTPEGDVIAQLINSVEVMVADVYDEVVALKTDVETIMTDISALSRLIENTNAMLSDIQGDIAEIKTDIGTILVKLSDLDMVITEVKSGIATIQTKLGTIKASIDAIRILVENGNAVLSDIQGSVATIKTDVGTIKATLSALQPEITAIKNDVAEIKTNIGTLVADVNTLKPVVTEIRDDVATVKTDVGEIKGKVMSIDGNVATIKTDVGTIKAEVSDTKSGVSDVKSSISTVSTLIIVAVVLSVVAAAASIYSVIALRKALVH